MTTAAVNYAKVLYGMPVSRATVQETEHLFQENPELTECLGSPLVSFEAKCRIIDRAVPRDMRSFVKVACRYHKTVGSRYTCSTSLQFIDGNGKRSS